MKEDWTLRFVVTASHRERFYTPASDTRMSIYSYFSWRKYIV